VRDLPATSLFADRAVRLLVRPRWRYRLLQAAGLALLVGIVYWLAADRRVAVIYIVATIAAFLVLRLVAAAIVWGARRAGPIRGTTLRLAVRNIQRPGALTASVVLSLGLGLTLLVALALIDANLRLQLTGEMAERAPDFYFLDIQDAERQEFEAALREITPGGEFERVPMLRGRFVALGGVPVSQIDPPEEVSWVVRGDRGLTYADEPPENSRVVAGEWWPADYDGEPLVSFAHNIAEALDLGIGDTVTVNVLGRNLEARIANLREVNWESLEINFVVVFSSNTFRGAPHAHLATLSLPDGAPPELDREVMRMVGAQFPGVTMIRVRDALEAISELIGDLALAVRVAASLALVISMLVLGGALAAGHRQRRQDAVILKALGATRQRLLGAFSLEYGLLGLATAIFAVAAGGVAAWYVVTNVMRAEFTFLPVVAVAAALIALAVTLGLGLAGTWRILSVRAAPHLRNL
jgi:putative ABC transport system permease protein